MLFSLISESSEYIPLFQVRAEEFAIGAALITTAQGVFGKNGWQPHNTADLGIDGIIYSIGAMSGPVGWIVAKAWFFGNLAYEHYYNRRSITEDALDH